MAKRYNKKNDTLLTVIVAILVAIILGVGVLIIGYVSRDANGKWFANSDLSSWHWADSKTNDDNGGNGNNNGGNNNGGDNVNEKTESNVIISEEISNSGVNVYSAVLPRSAYAANGISENADTAIKLTATIKPDYAYNKKVVFTAKWKNASSAWAQGKTITDYVVIETVGDLEANVVCKQAFGEPIEITCTIEGTDIKATCTADYLKKVTDINAVSGMTKQSDGSYLWVWNNYEVDRNIYGESPAPSLTFNTVCNGVGTKDAVSSDTSNQSIKIEFSTELATAFSPTKTSETYNGLTLDGKELFYVGNGGGKGFLYQKNIIEWYDYEDISVCEGYATLLTKCLSTGVDFNITVTAGNLTKTFNVNVVVAAESVEIPSDIEF